jgi:hypothetical protein
MMPRCQIVSIGLRGIFLNALGHVVRRRLHVQLAVLRAVYARRRATCHVSWHVKGHVRLLAQFAEEVVPQLVLLNLDKSAEKSFSSLHRRHLVLECSYETNSYFAFVSFNFGATRPDYF